ncbi:MAG: 4'-phosphopantetheinyl transferase superfamily protein [Thermodesulfobacteriota bacterium]
MTKPNTAISSLENDQIHIWKININNPKWEPSHLLSEVLSKDEKRRALRLKSEKDKNRFIVSRGHLRKKLESYLEISASEIEFSYNEYGKPSVKSEQNDKKIKFNVSHSADLIIYAVRQGSEVGIDVENIRDVNKADKIIGRFFNKQEIDYYHSHPQHKKKSAFFTLWTRKEAYSKAMGRGIGLPAKEIDLNLVTGRSLTTNGHKGKSKWSIFDIETENGYLAALATRGDNPNICCFGF